MTTAPNADDKNIINDFGVSRTISRGINIVVQVKDGSGWRDVLSFDRMSDDYAFTNAHEAAVQRSRSALRPGQ